MNTAAAQYRAVQRASANDFVTQHADLVRRIAHHLAARLPASVEIDELLQAGMIELTRQGGLHCPNLYAVTWIGIDDCSGKLDVKPNPAPSNLWRQPARAAA